MRTIALAMVMAGFPLCLLAETAFVTDNLRLGLHAAEDTQDEPFLTLERGTELEVLARISRFANVQMLDGTQGWVNSDFLVTEKPPSLRASDVEAALEIMRADLADAQAELQVADFQTELLGQDSQTRRPNEDVLESLAQLQREALFYEARMEDYRGSVPLKWTFSALVVALLGGFVAGMWCLDRLIRKRHGGFRVY
jgi:SH3 domain protein